MTDAHADASRRARPRTDRLRLGCVSYLNSKPLIHGLAEMPGPATTLRLDVPARLLADLESSAVDLALCPVVDYFRSEHELTMVPVGGIACEGPTLTVRLFSRRPIEQLTRIHTDTDSHTSVCLLRVLMHDLYALTPEVIDYPVRDAYDPANPPEAMLLIGDKVVTDSPPVTVYPYQLDLGSAWNDLTGRPFVFAIWLKQRHTDLGDLPQRLAALRDRNLGRVAALAEHYAPLHGWPLDLAEQYLGSTLRYRLGQRELDAIRHFAGRAHALGLLPSPLREPQIDPQLSM